MHRNTRNETLSQITVQLRFPETSMINKHVYTTQRLNQEGLIYCKHTHPRPINTYLDFYSRVNIYFVMKNNVQRQMSVDQLN